jgi:hypothetical protein
MTVKEHLLLKELGNANAFPQSKDDLTIDDEHGLTKREYFAAMAMQALLSDPNIATTYSKYAENAVQAADALIAELNK